MSVSRLSVSRLYYVSCIGPRCLPSLPAWLLTLGGCCSRESNHVLLVPTCCGQTICPQTQPHFGRSDDWRRTVLEAHWTAFQLVVWSRSRSESQADTANTAPPPALMPDAANMMPVRAAPPPQEAIPPARGKRPHSTLPFQAAVPLGPWAVPLQESRPAGIPPRLACPHGRWTTLVAALAAHPRAASNTTSFLSECAHITYICIHTYICIRHLYFPIYLRPRTPSWMHETPSPPHCKLPSPPQQLLRRCLSGTPAFRALCAGVLPFQSCICVRACLHA